MLAYNRYMTIHLSEGSAALRERTDCQDAGQRILADEVRAFGARAGIEALADFQRATVSHIVCLRRRPTLAQAVALWHLCDIEPGDWFRAPQPKGSDNE